MWFLKEFSFPLYILRFCGICSYSLNVPLNKIQSKTHHFVYTVLVSSTIFSVTVYLSYHSYVTDLKIDFFKQISTITSLMFMTSTITTYSLMIILSTKKRLITSNFLNNFNEILLSINKLNLIRKKHNYYHIITFVIYFTLNSVGVAFIDWNFSMDYLIMDILYCWMEITIFLQFIFIIYLTVSINNQFAILFDNLQQTLELDLSVAKNYEKLSIIFERLEDLFGLNFQLENIFGEQLIVNFTYDFVVLTISIYLTILFARPSNLQQQDNSFLGYYFFMFHTVPHGLKLLFISQSMDKLGKQVKKI